MGTFVLPNIGDIITFAPVWQLTIKCDNNKYPCGIITSITTYDTVASEYKDDLMGTLAYPLTIDQSFFDKTRVYVVQWASNNINVVQSYRLVNEEWFYNNSFIIVSRA